MAKGTESEKDLWYLQGINLYCSEETLAGGGGGGGLLLKTLSEYEKSGFKQAGNNTLVCEAIKNNNYFHVRLIFTNGVIESTLSSPRFLGSN